MPIHLGARLRDREVIDLYLTNRDSRTLLGCSNGVGVSISKWSPML